MTARTSSSQGQLVRLVTSGFPIRKNSSVETSATGSQSNTRRHQHKSVGEILRGISPCCRQFGWLCNTHTCIDSLRRIRRGQTFCLDRVSTRGDVRRNSERLLPRSIRFHLGRSQIGRIGGHPDLCSRSRLETCPRGNAQLSREEHQFPVNDCTCVGFISAKVDFQVGLVSTTHALLHQVYLHVGRCDPTHLGNVLTLVDWRMRELTVAAQHDRGCRGSRGLRRTSGSSR